MQHKLPFHDSYSRAKALQIKYCSSASFCVQDEPLLAEQRPWSHLLLYAAWLPGICAAHLEMLGRNSAIRSSSASTFPVFYTAAVAQSCCMRHAAMTLHQDQMRAWHLPTLR